MAGNSGGLDAALLAKHRAVCENALQRLTSGLGPEDVAARDAAYARIRESNESFIAKSAGKVGDGAAVLRDIVEEIIALDVTAGGRQRPTARIWLSDPSPRWNRSIGPRRPSRQRRSALFGRLDGAGLAVLAGIGL
jgi:hypothetical protein